MTIEKILKNIGNNFLNLEKGFAFGPQGKILHKNIEEIWYKYCIVMPSYNIFLSSNDKINETMENLKKFGITQKPIGISSIEESKILWNNELIQKNCKINSHKIAKVISITDSINGKDLYHRKQRERKVWWRKFSREPSRFKFTESKKINKNKDYIEIIAQFDFGNITVETITYQQDVKKLFKEQNDIQDIQIVEHVASLDWGCLAFLCDAYTEDNDNYQLKLHPKFSPYKVGFYITEEDIDIKSQEKSRLSMYLNNLIKSKGIETVVTTNFVW